ncbi:zinc-dependent metalloprotease [Microbacterium dauci]|uniref:Zinc-dependent metalloprotease n=1 Tax=Microbacterium dauci TaxID=3048008 RepID=A0ABT6ZCY1_9MICO|nr:zinc-dependent metalloprotease [Microbacterium sp. LX3-4]MDJ1113507.1 zinc-dependent metalloprotease [Microbacterium sp. LX3-4]
MSDDDRPDDDLAEMLRRLLSGQGGIDPEELQRMSGLNLDPAMMQNVMRHLQQAMSGTDEGIDWSSAKTGALHIANQDGLGITSGARQEFDQAFTLASLWLSEATAIGDLAAPPRAITRSEWVEATLPVWQELAEPVASSISDALMGALESQTPDEMRSAIAGAGRIIRNVGGALFANQLGTVIGRLSLEVVSGGDVGIPLMPDGAATILPQNFADFGRDLEIAEDQLALALATRELAHARLFRHARWLRLHVISQVTDFARGVHVDVSALEELAERFDPSSPDELRGLIESGALLPQRSEAQVAALTRLENLLATIEGWVDVVTADALTRLPAADKIAETVRRRRAAGGPGERAMASLVGLELRPRRLREAAAMWRAVTDAVGPAARDALWDYPDLMPGADDIDDPAGLVARLQAHARGETPAPDAFDDALAELLAAEEGRPEEGDEEGPSGPRPV